MSFIQNKDLLELISALSTVTELPVSVHDTDFNILPGFDFSYRTDFCSEMQKNPEFEQKCRECDRYACKKVYRTKSLLIYKCHAGLLELCAPIIKNDKICGYIMLGQFTVEKDLEELTDQLIKACSAYESADKIRELSKSISQKSSDYLFSASLLLDICASHIQLKAMLHPTNEHFLELIEAYVNNHLSETITLDTLCAEFNISRSRLYETFSNLSDGGIASFVRNIRLSNAKNLLKSTDLSVVEIAHRTGFSSENYFSKVFKQKYGVTPNKFRKNTK